MSLNGSADGKMMLLFIIPATPALVQLFSIIFAPFALVKMVIHISDPLCM